MLGMNRSTVKRWIEEAQPPRHRREPVVSMLEPSMPVIREVLKEVEDITAPRLTELSARTMAMRDWWIWFATGWRGCAPRLSGRRRKRLRAGASDAGRLGGDADRAEGPRRKRRVYALICNLGWAGFRTRASNNLRAAVAGRERVDGRESCIWNARAQPRPLRLPPVVIGGSVSVSGGSFESPARR